MTTVDSRRSDVSPGRPDALRGWEEVLDRLEEDLSLLDGMLDESEVVPQTSWAPPADLGALPEELRERADELLVRLGRVQQRTRERLGTLADELRNVNRQRRAGEAYAKSR